MDRRFSSLTLILSTFLVLFAQPAQSGDFDRRLRPLAKKILLGVELSEISGLAPAPGGELYAHGDEKAEILEIEPLTGRVIDRFAFGDPPVAGDFEAIVAAGGAVSLITSGGDIYVAHLARNRKASPFERFDTKLGRKCEIEAFAAAEAPGAYFIACKQANKRLVVYEWSRKEGARRVINVKLNALAPNPKTFRATDIVRDERKKTLLVLDAADAALLEVTMKGAFVGYWRLGGKHRQAEGLAVLSDGKIVVADEGGKTEGRRNPGYLTIYPPRE